MNANILIVDDDKISQIYYRKKLEGIKNGVFRECMSGAETLKAIEEFEPDIVLMDYQLPDMTGLELTSYIVMKYPQIIIIAISGDDSDTLETEMLELGAISFMRKPVPGKVLFFTVQNLIEIVIAKKKLEVERKPAADNAYVCHVTYPKEEIKEEKSDQFVSSFVNTAMSTVEYMLLNNIPDPKTPDEFFNSLRSDAEYLDDFLEAADDMSYNGDKIYDDMNINTLMLVAADLEKNSRKLDYLVEFPSISYALRFVSNNLVNRDYSDMNEIAFRKLCVFVYDFVTMYNRWVKSVFIERLTDNVHFMDFEILSFVMQMESIFYDTNVLSEDDESAADEGGSIEFF